ncbi:MAG: hypothetical protein L6R30_22225 [Thermoanaerobaculia bacterium]|nr:hypothetical protein [Thermoanaerobaculia bacterium]
MPPAPLAPAPPLPGSDQFGAAVSAIEAELASPMGQRDRVLAACEVLRSCPDALAGPDGSRAAQKLALLVIKKAGAIVEPVAALLLESTLLSPSPWPVLEALLAAPNKKVAQPALEQTARLAAEGRLTVTLRVAESLAAISETSGSVLGEKASLSLLGQILSRLLPWKPEQSVELTDLVVEAPDHKLRHLVARLLDLSGTPPPPSLATRILREEATTFLAPYLAFTRASHVDLLDLVVEPGSPPPALDSIRKAESECGSALLREILAELGWRRVSAGLSVHPFAAVSVGGSFPLLMRPAEALLVEDPPQVRRVFDRWLAVAHGGTLAHDVEDASDDDPVNRFRLLNVRHADILGDFLDVAPLTAEKVRHVLQRMDGIVEDYTVLFRTRAAEECGVVLDVYRDLKARVERELEAAQKGRPLTIELTRLVQMFEDPRNAGEVRTLHGLKRYLHQKGLKLGFKLAEAVRGTNRTVDLAVATPLRVIHVARVLEYVDFEKEPEENEETLGIPWPVWIAAEGFSRQLLHGQQNLPRLRAFCYGNEVHYYLTFRNHPVFVRVDYAPPLRGGMVDLEYYGVSKYELDSHPNPSLDGIGRFFKKLDINVEIDNTRIHARYDKERAVDLADLCEKVEAVFRLAPYLMDIDWVSGGLALDPDAREAVADAWAAFFSRWGVLPLSQILSADKLGILVSLEPDVTGVKEVRWNGKGPYRDRFSTGSLAFFWEKVRAALLEKGLRDLAAFRSGEEVAQLSLEREVLRPLRAAVCRGEVLESAQGIGPAEPALYQKTHEARRFAELLARDSANLIRSSRVARLASALEKHLRFQSTGSVNGYDVQRAVLPLKGESITLFVLRDSASVYRLAFFTFEGPVFRRRQGPSDEWVENALFDSDVLAQRLLRNNLPASGLESETASAEAAAESLRAIFRIPNPHEHAPRLPGERLVQGIAAAPGHAVGIARLGLGGRQPEDVDGAILVAASVRPEDGPLLFRAAGVVSTGGGVLSHAGLLAMQFGKPALVVPGTWEVTPGGTLSIGCRRFEFDEETVEAFGMRVVEKRNLREEEDRIADGDLLVLDADSDVLRVLGQDRDTLALHDGLHQLTHSVRSLAVATSDEDILNLRGRRLRARRQIEKLFSRMADPVLACHAVRELLAGEAASCRADQGELLRELLRNRSVGDAARAAIHQIASDLRRWHAAECEEAASLIPTSADAHEILALRRDALRLGDRLAVATSCLSACGISLDLGPVPQELDSIARPRLLELRAGLETSMLGAIEPGGNPRHLRHLLRQVIRLDGILGAPVREPGLIETLERRVLDEDEAVLSRLANRRVLTDRDGGIELRPHVGSKAAALAEASQLGEGSRIPPWFVITDLAFRDVLEGPAPDLSALPGTGGPGFTLGRLIEEILARKDWDAGTKSTLIRRAWKSATLPPSLVEEINDALSPLSRTERPFVAIRSSAREEDTETDARAGEFDTFLFVPCGPAVLEFLRLAWAGLWNQRSLLNRQATGRDTAVIGGGVLIQHMVDSRVSGVLHTVNVAENRPREVLINAGLGLGEGVVSGLVAADQITVEKDAALSGDDMHFRYLTRDKRDRIVFNTRTGAGTQRVETLYHQRLRPALEYVELCELVHAAIRLEALHGHPLDIEFAIEGAGLCLLQIRPVPAALAVWTETASRYPIAPGDRR